ncbi:uncharacterized protein At3g49055 [Mercurialis annua]|uniref:uncharacterized protein At3g49055 n=1 Tax=Mercurialis annua TaxID=3986 RepID=UPI00215F5C20|nr:uncharacterized protein At3g49055 [Mercurialis annua]
MASGTGDDNDAVLSDVEGDDPVPIVIRTQSLEQEEITVDKYRQLLAELDREKSAREAAETAKSELQVSFNRLKALAHEAIKKRDEWSRQREEALREKERISLELSELSKQRDEIAKKFDEISKVRDGLESEIESSRHMLVSGIEKISNKVSNYKNFSGLGLPRSQKYSNGLPAAAYGVIKRTNEIIEEMIKQMDIVTKSRNEAREQVEQRNYEIAIEVSQLEAAISGLRDEVGEKSLVIENLEKSLAEKEEKVFEIESELKEKTQSVEKEGLEMREVVREYDEKLKSFESKIESQRPLLIDQLSLVAKIHDRLYDVIKIVDSNHLDSELSESLFLPQQTDMEENIRASLAGMESIYELTRIVSEKTRSLLEDKSHEVKSLNETVGRLVKEKEHIGSLLRSAFSKRMKLVPSSKTNELFQAAENGLKEAGIDFKFSKVLGDKAPASPDKGGSLDTDEDEIYTLAGALENIVKASQLEIIELQHTVDELRAEVHLLKEHVEAQSKELANRMHRIEELEEKERVANESVEGLMMDIAASEEEITRWKVAAEQEAAAGRAVEQEFASQLSAIKQELEEARLAMLESEKKLKFKEETAAAAMAAREAAEKSLRLADLRASRLRDRVEELSRQLEAFETREDSRGRNGPRYVCWPWQWLGLEFVGARRLETEQQRSNEMELSEPLSEPLL